MTSSNEPSWKVEALNLKTGKVTIEQVPLSQMVTPSKPVSELTPCQISRLTRLYQKVGYLIDEKLSTWIYDFTYELHPEREIQIWEEMAAVFEKYNKTHKLAFSSKREILRLLLGLLGGEQPKDSVSLELVKLFKQQQASSFCIRPHKPLTSWENINYKMFAQIYTAYVERHQIKIHDNKDELFVTLMRLVEGQPPQSELGQELLGIWSEIHQAELAYKQEFNPLDIKDERKKSKRAVVIRPGQRKFKLELMKAYGGCCSITGCPVEAVLQAAHIIPYLGAKTDHPSNGLLLRVDIHQLFDSYYLSINPETYKVEMATVLSNSCYWDLREQPLRMPKSKTARPNSNALLKHYQIFKERWFSDS
ncbi:HNH endonuclease signature motif containing protein [Allocoleopsis sp.]|uniref:HNH endonuclease n=1 Tax=Allocoleopsis sp. TaxID=3088169 RepID=UPI002FD36DB4